MPSGATSATRAGRRQPVAALGGIALARGDVDQARDTLLDARACGGRATDGWRFAHAEVLDALAALGPHFPARAAGWISELELVAAASGMRELLVRAHLHRARTGVSGALDAAVALAEGIENPALTRLLTRA